ncbi:MAG: hypothetical protein Fur0024_2030 [Patescibacteria group bacterium]
MKKLAFLRSIKEKDKGSLVKRILEEKKLIKETKINLKLGKEKNYRKLINSKKAIARMLTVLNQLILK